jgi:archaellum biogenesis protein FlaJ (TadC family)
MLPVLDWAHVHQVLVGWLSLISVITFFGTLLIIPLMVARMPEDYFLYDKRHLKEFRRQHPIVRIFSVIFKNLLGAVFIVTGFIMLFIPGQGVLTILIGLTLVNFPKKRALERRIIQQETMHRAINWIRAKAGKPPVKVPERSPG